MLKTPYHRICIKIALVFLHDLSKAYERAIKTLDPPGHSLGLADQNCLSRSKRRPVLAKYVDNNPIDLNAKCRIKLVISIPRARLFSSGGRASRRKVFIMGLTFGVNIFYYFSGFFHII